MWSTRRAQKCRSSCCEANRAWHIGATYDCVNNSNVECWRNGNSSNHFTVGIEHGGYASQTSWPTAQIDLSAKLSCDISKAYNIPRDVYHFVGHGQLQPASRTDPGANWPWTTYLSKINAECGSGQIIIDSNNSNNDQNVGYIQVSSNWTSASSTAGYYGSGYYFANTAAVSDPAAFYFYLPTAQTRTVDAWWTTGANRSTTAPFQAYNAAWHAPQHGQREPAGEWWPVESARHVQLHGRLEPRAALALDDDRLRRDRRRRAHPVSRAAACRYGTIRAGRLLMAGALLGLAACRPAEPPLALAGQVAFVSERDGNPEVYRLDLASGTTTRLTHRPASDYPAAALSGGDVLVVAAEGDGAGTRESLWRATAAGVLQPLRLTARTLRHPVVVPDGRTLLFEADFASVRDLYRYTFATDSVARLTDQPSGNYDPSPGPGGRIALASSREGQAEVYTMPATGEGPGGDSLRRLTAFHRDDWAPRWSPDGRWIAFLSLREGPPRLFLVSPDGTNLRRLLAPSDTLGADMQEGEAVWSPDGRFIAVPVLPRTGGAQLWVADVATGRRWRVGATLPSASDPAWRPDASALVFSGHAPGGDAELYAARRDGTGLTRLTTSPGPDWLPVWLR